MWLALVYGSAVLGVGWRCFITGIAGSVPGDDMDIRVV